MTDQITFGVSKDDDIPVVEDALDAARREHDAADASRAALITQICAAYVGVDGPLGPSIDDPDDPVLVGDGSAETNPPDSPANTEYAYRNKSLSWMDDDAETVIIPDAARGITLDTFGNKAYARYLVPVDAQAADGEDA